MIVYDRATEERIKELNRELEPFYLVSGDDGQFSLCARMNFMGKEFGWASFEAYAIAIGEEPHDEQGYVNYGSGYDWEAAFKEAFKDDPNLKRIYFDCEECGFFCDGDDLDMMADFGKRFRELCQDTERFTPIVYAGIQNDAQRRAEEERLNNTVRGYLMKNPMAEYDIRTQQGNFTLEAGTGQALLDGTLLTIISESDGVELTADEFLDYRVTASQQDLFDENVFKLKAEIEQEEILAPTMKM